MSEFDTLRTNIERRFTHLESKIDLKPNVTTILALRTDIEALSANIERRFTHLGSKIDQKPTSPPSFWPC